MASAVLRAVRLLIPTNIRTHHSWLASRHSTLCELAETVGSPRLQPRLEQGKCRFVRSATIRWDAARLREPRRMAQPLIETR